MTQADLNALLNTLVPMAQMLLTKQGEVYPIGAVMLSDREIRHVGAKIEGNDHPPSEELIELLTETFKDFQKGGCKRQVACRRNGLRRTIPPGKSQKQDAMFAANRTLQFFDQISRC